MLVHNPEAGNLNGAEAYLSGANVQRRNFDLAVLVTTAPSRIVGAASPGRKQSPQDGNTIPDGGVAFLANRVASPWVNDRNRYPEVVVDVIVVFLNHDAANFA